MTGKNIPYMSFCTKSEHIKLFICDHINNTLNIEKHPTRNKRDNIYNITLTKEQSQQYGNLLYDNSKIFLDRKYNKYIDICKWERPTTMRKR